MCVCVCVFVCVYTYIYVYIYIYIYFRSQDSADILSTMYYEREFSLVLIHFNIPSKEKCIDDVFVL